MIKIAAVGVAAVLMAMQLREMKPEYGMYLIFGTGLLIFFYAAKKLSFLVETLEELRAAASIDSQYLEILLKMLGISYLSEFAASLCRDGGYGSAAGQIELFGKLSILVVSMPVVRALLETMGGLLS